LIAAACEQTPAPQAHAPKKVAVTKAALCSVVDITDCEELQAMEDDLDGCYVTVHGWC
jgi:hypothetical protein